MAIFSSHFDMMTKQAHSTLPAIIKKTRHINRDTIPLIPVRFFTQLAAATGRHEINACTLAKRQWLFFFQVSFASSNETQTKI